MKLITYLVALVISVIIFPVTNTVSAQEWGQDRSINQLSKSVYRWGSGSDNSAYILTSEGIILIDGSSCDSGDTEWIKEELERQYDVPVKYVILSHDHASHICGTQIFRDTAVTIGQRKILPHILRENRLSAAPNITFEDSMDIHLGGLDVVLHYFGPTHSDNLIQIHIPEEGVLIAIDMSRAGKTLVFPDFRDMDVNNTVDALGILSRLENVEIVLPGHGQATNQQSFSIYREYLRTLRDTVLDLMVDGKSLEQILQEVTMGEFSDFEFHDRWLRPNILSMYEYLYSYREPNEDTLREYQQSRYPVGPR